MKTVRFFRRWQTITKDKRKGACVVPREDNLVLEKGRLDLLVLLVGDGGHASKRERSEKVVRQTPHGLF